jgi:hypothetical protein
MTLRSGASLAVAAAALLAGCGSGKPQEVAVRYASTNHADKCGLLTQALVEQLTRERGAAARAACRRNVVRFPAPKDVRVRGVSGGDEPDGDAGEAARGGVEAESEVRLTLDGREAEIRLVKQHDHWQIAALGE